MKEASSMGKAKPTTDQAKVEKLFPAIARYVRGYGYIEIGDQESFGFVVRAIGYGGLAVAQANPASRDVELEKVRGRHGAGGPAVRDPGWAMTSAFQVQESRPSLARSGHHGQKEQGRGAQI
jgi:hypothetical protein